MSHLALWGKCSRWENYGSLLSRRKGSSSGVLGAKSLFSHFGSDLLEVEGANKSRAITLKRQIYPYL